VAGYYLRRESLRGAAASLLASISNISLIATSLTKSDVWGAYSEDGIHTIVLTMDCANAGSAQNAKTTAKADSVFIKELLCTHHWRGREDGLVQSLSERSTSFRMLECNLRKH
jgi:hypothetical protein